MGSPALTVNRGELWVDVTPGFKSEIERQSKRLSPNTKLDNEKNKI